MTKRPHSITVIGWIFIAAGVVGLAYHANEFEPQRPFDHDFFWICFVRLLPILCGVFMLRGHNWARWGLVVWLGYHIIIGALHTPFQLVVHSVLFAGVIYFLFRARASAYFQGMRAENPGSMGPS